MIHHPQWLNERWGKEARRGPSVGVRHFEIFDHPYLPQVQEAAIVFERVGWRKLRGIEYLAYFVVLIVGL